MAGTQLSLCQQLLGRYTILEMIGAGAMGHVYRAHDSRLERDVAIKLIAPGFLNSETRRERLRQEALAISQIEHPSVATIFDFATEGAQDYLICEYIAGCSVAEMIAANPILEKEVLELATQLAEGLAACHDRKIVHGDIKPANLRVTPDHRLKIVDFGLASASKLSFSPDDETIESVAELAGTLPYMSPEQLSGRAGDPRSDLFSAGCVLYELITRKPPFEGKTLSAIIDGVLHREPIPPAVHNPEVSSHLVSIIARSLEKDPELRYQSARDLLADLRRAVISVPQEHSLAVLYFENLSQDKDDEYFRDGITEDLITELSKIKDLRVFSRSAVFGYRDRPVTPLYIGQQLKTPYVLEGSIRRDRDRLRLTASLSDTSTGHTLWAERYDRRLQDLFAVQDDLAKSIARELQIALTGLEKSSIGRAPTSSIGAYDLYLRGRHFFHQFRRTGLDFARSMFSRAIEADPNFAKAYAGLANCHSLLYMYWDSNPSHLGSADAASRTALDLDSALAESRVSRGLTASLKKDFDEAQRQFDEAIRLNARLFDPYYFSGRNAYSRGDYEHAVWWFEQASQVDPDDYQALMLRASALSGLKRTADAQAVYRLGMQQAERHLENNPGDARALYFGANALAQLGDRTRAMKWAFRAVELEPSEPMVLYNVACVYALLMEPDLALDALEKSVTTGWAQRQWMVHDPDLASVRDHPRFSRILETFER